MKKILTLLSLALLSLSLFACEDSTTLEDYNLAPEIFGEEVYTVEVNDNSFSLEKLIYVEDDFDGTSFIQESQIDYKNFDITKLGIYKVELSVKDSYDVLTEKSITIKVVDTIAPEITLNGDSDITILKDSAYNEQGATVTDNYNQDLQVDIIGTVDTSKEGSYTLEYTVQDSSRNSDTVYRTVNVVSVDQALSINKDKATSNSISFKTNILNNQTFDEITEISLYKDNVLVTSVTNLNTRTFTNLEPNTNYQIKVTYSQNIPGLTKKVSTTLLIFMSTTPEEELDRNGLYTSRDDVALYLYLYGELPSNYMTKSEAGTHISNIYTSQNKASIGGDHFGNYEGLLPEKSGRSYYEVDIDYSGGSSRGSRRIVYSSDGFIFYTGDHYDSFKLYDPLTKTWINYSKNDPMFD